MLRRTGGEVRAAGVRKREEEEAISHKTRFLSIGTGEEGIL